MKYIGRPLKMILTALVLSCSSNQPAPPSALPPEVVVIEAHPRDVQLTREFIGTVDAVINAEIRARVAGYIRTQDFQDGTFVKKGQVLFTLDPTLTRANTTQAIGDHNSAKAALAKAILDAKRIQKLAQTGAATKEEVDNALSAEQIARATVMAAKGNLQSAQANLGYTRITSPIDGLAGLAQVRTGTLVGQGEPTLLAVVSQIDPVRFTFAISEQTYLEYANRLGQVQHGGASDDKDELELVLADGSTYAHRGRLDVVDRQVDSATGAIMLQAVFPNPELILRPGMYGKLRAHRGLRKSVISVPQRAVKELQGTHQVIVVGEDDRAEVRTVTLGERFDNQWIVEKGVSPGERVIVEGLQKVQNGVVVRPILQEQAVNNTKASSTGDHHE